MRYMMVDSSPQGGRDYEMMYVVSIQESSLLRAFQLVDVMRNLEQDARAMSGEEAITTVLESQSVVMQELSSMLDVHRPPPVMLGSGRTTLPDKYAAVCHALYLETGSGPNLQRFMGEMLACTSDMGVEFNIAKCKGASAVDLLPWSCKTVEPIVNAEREEDWIDPPPPPVWLAFANCVAVPGLLHILHNEAGRMLEGIPHLSATVEQMQTVADLLRKKASKERLRQRCYNSAMGAQLFSSIRAFEVVFTRPVGAPPPSAQSSC